MPIEILPESEGNYVAARGSGKLTDDDYKHTFLPKLSEAIKEHGSANVLIIAAPDFAGWTLHAMWDDARFGWIHRNDFERIAIVGGPACAEWTSKLVNHLMKGEIKAFKAEEEDAARAFVKGA